MAHWYMFQSPETQVQDISFSLLQRWCIQGSIWECLNNMRLEWPWEFFSPAKAAQNKISCEMRPGCSGHYPDGSWKFPEMETAQSPWAAHSIACLCSFRKKFSLYDISICLVLISVCFLSYSHYAQPLCHFYNLPIGTRKPLLCAL